MQAARHHRGGIASSVPAGERMNVNSSPGSPATAGATGVRTGCNARDLAPRRSSAAISREQAERT